MLRISVIDSSDRSARLRLEGRLVGPWVRELRKSCESVLSRGGRLTLDLEGLSFIDREGITLLRTLKGNQVNLANGSPFVAELLKGGTSVPSRSARPARSSRREATR